MSQVLLKKKFTCSTHLNTYFSVRCVIFQSESKTAAGTISIYPQEVFLIKRSGNEFRLSGEFCCCHCYFSGQKMAKNTFKYQGQQFSNAGARSHFLEISVQKRIDLIHQQSLLVCCQYLLVRRMQRTVNDCTSSHNNMLVPEEEIVEEQSVHQEEQSLRKENQELKVPQNVMDENHQCSNPREN